ncbi:MAG: hypothetical protein N5P05_003855 [Chroococcopsis gigantea SAG 12.99]|jgi:glycosyltransferase involved in cell wall biosynthesis|nr:glycosyltransferase family 4 protein [Chlorogloea purpurea SAG 13.99]MDV3002249.1 hypothetical protein [Chroococcopsis gigantea SAG 12.99]
MVEAKKSPLKSIGIYHPYFLGGGAETVALWILEALKDQYDITLFTSSDLNWEKLNLMYGTSLDKDAIKVRSLFPGIFLKPANFLLANLKQFKQFATHQTLAELKKYNQDYDLVFSTYNGADLGKPGIQYIHWIQVIEGSKPDKNYYNRLSNFSLDNLKKNHSLANSRVVADCVKQTYGINSSVIYPPVVIQSFEIPWLSKENAFVCSGRLVEAKQPHRVIKILKAVRERGADVKLYITGGGGGSYQNKYKRFLDKIVAENSDWVKVLENLPYTDYCQLLYRCKYGIHFKQEPFGISVAEMVKAGMIVLGRAQGGQVEIIGAHNQELLFNNDVEAIEKIVRVLSDETKQQQLLQSLETQKHLFSTQKFIREIQEVVAEYFQGKL